MSIAPTPAQTPLPEAGTSEVSSIFSTLFTSSVPTSSSTSAATSTTTTSSSRPLFSDDAPDTSFDQNDDNDGIDDRHSGLINYYFVFLALLIFLAFLGIYFLNRRRRARKLAYLNSGQNALARDMDGWVSNATRWHWRNNSRTEGNEGLNELGQPPPAYSAKTHGRESTAEVGTTSGEPQIPLRTLARDERDRDLGEPPEYNDAVRPGSSAGNRPATESGSQACPYHIASNSDQEGAPRS